MAFAVTLRFTGLCGHVPNADLDSEPTRVWVVMPRMTSPPKDTICKHFPAMVVDAVHVDGSGVGSSKLFRRLHRAEVTFTPRGVDGAEVAALTIPDDDADTDFRHVPNLGEIVPAAAKVRPDFRDDKASASFVIARILLQHGELKGLPRSKGTAMYFPGGANYATEDEAKYFVHDVVVDLGELDALEIHIRDLDSAASETLRLSGNGAEPCEVLFGNLCGDVWVKELGGLLPYPDTTLPVVDRDFEGMYALSTNPPEGALVDGPPGQVPLPTWKGAQGGDTKCHQAIFDPFEEAGS